MNQLFRWLLDFEKSCFLYAVVHSAYPLDFYEKIKVRYEKACDYADMHDHWNAVQFGRVFVENVGRHAHSLGMCLESDALNKGTLST